MSRGIVRVARNAKAYLDMKKSRLTLVLLLLGRHRRPGKSWFESKG